MDDAPPSEADLTCPDCGACVALAAGTLTATCPRCGLEFLAVVDDEEAPDDEVLRRRAEQAARPAEEALDTLRVRHLIEDRRHFLRTRVWQLTGAFLCVGLALQSVWYSIRDLRGRDNSAAAVSLGIAVVLGACAVPLFVRARRNRLEAERPTLREPAMPPRFEELSDGRQFARNLDDLN